mmetsp:Transcript_1444/g.2187  ORF Transcript_1444/g.2187 Transcript_1444/m.2187 type:complete len:371 (+) Transcript_1444:198-1310(+)
MGNINKELLSFFKNHVNFTDNEVKEAWEQIIHNYKGVYFNEKGRPINKNIRITAMDVVLPKTQDESLNLETCPNSPNHNMTKIDLNHRIYKTYKKETSFLNYIIMNRKPNIVKYFLNQPFQYPYCSTCYQNTAMHAAVLRADGYSLDIIKLLVNKFRSNETLLFQRNAMSLTPLEIAVILNKKDVFDFLLEEQIHYYEKKYDYQSERMTSLHMTKINFVVEHGRVHLFQQLEKKFGTFTVCAAIIGKTIIRAINDEKLEMIHYLIQVMPQSMIQQFLMEYQSRLSIDMILTFDEHYIIKHRPEKNEAYISTIHNTKVNEFQQLNIDPICQMTNGEHLKYAQTLNGLFKKTIERQRHAYLFAFEELQKLND